MPELDPRCLEEFIERIGAAVGRNRSETETVTAVKEIVTESLGSKGWVPDRCLATVADCYARHLLYKDPAERFAIVVMVWGEGQSTPIHDHGGIWCVEGVYKGRIRVTRYDQQGPVEGGVVRFRRGEVIDAGMGATGALIPPVEHHSIENPFDQAAVTVHTYGGDLSSCQVYLPRADGAYDIHTKPLGYSSLPESHGGRAFARG